MAQGNDSVRVVIFDSRAPDIFLVLTEVDDPDNWKLPGGKFDTEDEAPQAAALRELGEELGLSMDAVDQVSELRNDDGVSRRYIFSAQIEKAAVQPSAEIAQTKWVKLETIPEGKNRQHIYSAVRSCNL